MECNKDEAIRAQLIAEKKFRNRDFAGAKRFALKAQSLYPPLEGISQMLSTFNVHIAAQIRVAGEIDWYGVLGITPTADDDTVRKQYQKLVLLLRPDKNKSVGADGAFKLILEAWNLLSDKAKRLAYNLRVQTQPQRPYSASNSNGFGNSTNSVPSMPTFWTICMHCKMAYEYQKIYQNASLLCVNCRKVFMAIKIVRNTAATEKIRRGSTGPNSFYPTTASRFDPFVAAKTSNVDDQGNSRLKREREESEDSAQNREASSKRRVLFGDELPFQIRR